MKNMGTKSTRSRASKHLIRVRKFRCISGYAKGVEILKHFSIPFSDILKKKKTNST
jgi:hypothetical protein